WFLKQAAQCACSPFGPTSPAPDAFPSLWYETQYGCRDGERRVDGRGGEHLDEPSIEVRGCQGCTLDHGQVVQVVRTLRLYPNASTQQSLIRPADRLARDDHAIPGARQRHRICPHDGGAKRSRSGGPGRPRWPNLSGKSGHPWGTSGTRGAGGSNWPHSSRSAP